MGPADVYSAETYSLLREDCPMVKRFSVQHLEGYRVSNLKVKFRVYLQIVGYDEIVRRLKDLIDNV